LFTKFIAIAEWAPYPRDKAGEHRAILPAAIDLAVKLIEQPIRATTANLKKYIGHLPVD
jgi:GntR family transcriptional regulator, carbon starvation induced regulator